MRAEKGQLYGEFFFPTTRLYTSKKDEAKLTPTQLLKHKYQPNGKWRFSSLQTTQSTLQYLSRSPIHTQSHTLAAETTT